MGCKKQEAQTDQVAEQPKPVREIWTKEQANEWYKDKGWLRGSDFIPSSAINQLEMWQAETFDTTTINRELGYAESIGLNSMRVYLHHLAWEVEITALTRHLRVVHHAAARNEHSASIHRRRVDNLLHARD